MQLAGSDRLLVHRLVDGVGNSKPGGNLLASFAWVVGGYVPFRHGLGLPGQLVQESFFSLCHHGPSISDRRSHVPTIGSGDDARQHRLGLAVCSDRRRHWVCAGVAVRAAFSVVTDVISPSQDFVFASGCASFWILWRAAVALATKFAAKRSV